MAFSASALLHLGLSQEESFTMSRFVVNSKVSSDGTLRLSLPLGLAEANHDVRVIVESLSSQKTNSASEWEAWVDEMAGSWKGAFERPNQGEFEERNPLS
jgi:hypothetical protein